MKNFFSFIAVVLLEFFIKLFQTIYIPFAVGFNTFLSRILPLLAYNNKSALYAVLKTLIIIIFIVPYLAIALSEFIVVYVITVSGKLLCGITAIIPFINLLLPFVFGVLTTAISYFFEIVFFVLAFPNTAIEAHYNEKVSY